MKKRPLLFLAALIVGGVTVSCGTRVGPEALEPGRHLAGFAEKIRVYEEFVRAEMERRHIPGLTVGFIRGSDVWVKGFGYADLENRIPAEAESSYRLASITKSMTAVAILQLTEKGQIDLEAEIHAYVPHFAQKKWPITVRQILHHLSGLRHNSEAEKVLTRHLTTAEAVAQYADSELLSEPGTRFSYSTPGYVLLGAAIESVSKQSYSGYMARNIWAPLDMKDTRMDDPSDLIPKRVRGYRLVEGIVKNSQPVDVSNRFSAGGVRTTVADMLKFVRGLNAGKLLSAQSRDLMFTSSITRDGRLTDAGMGWFLGSVNGRFTVTNNGGQQETRTVLYDFPSANFAIALAMNFEINEYMPFVERLYQVLTGEPWSTYMEKTIATQDAASAALAQGFQDVFFYGSSFYDQRGRALSRDALEIAAAVDYFKKIAEPDSLRADPEGAKAKFEDGLNPLTGQPLLIVGSFMAEQISKLAGRGRLEAARAKGTLSFFAEYVKICHADPAYPREFRFGAALEETIGRWARIRDSG